MPKLIVAFRYFAKAPKMIQLFVVKRNAVFMSCTDAVIFKRDGGKIKITASIVM